MRLTGKARTAGIVGWPVGHSRSPRLHGWWLEKYAIDGAYIPLPVPPDELGRALRALPALGFSGVNITVPHKQAVLSLLDEVDAVARRIGAVNTLVVRDGALCGINTDAFGFMSYLRESQPAFDPRRGPAVLLGAGGAARAVAAALIDAGVPELRLVARTQAIAEALAGAIGGPIQVLGWDKRADALAGAALLVNSTVLGMHGQAPLDLRLDDLPKGAVVDDIVYAPLETDLMARAAARGNPVVDGLGMLIHQGRPAFAAFFGPLPEVTGELRALMLSA